MLGAFTHLRGVFHAAGTITSQLGGVVNYAIFSFWLFISFAGWIIALSCLSALQRYENDTGLSVDGKAVLMPLCSCLCAPCSASTVSVAWMKGGSEAMPARLCSRPWLKMSSNGAKFYISEPFGGEVLACTCLLSVRKVEVNSFSVSRDLKAVSVSAHHKACLSLSQLKKC